MDPDGDYESRNSLPADDEEMGLKPSSEANTSNILLAEEKAGGIDLTPWAPPLDVECLPSAPPYEPSLHPSPEDDTATPSTDGISKYNSPPEPPGFKDDSIKGSNTIAESVPLPIGLDCTDRGIPVASAVPIITNAKGTEIFAPPTQAPATTSANEESTIGSISQQSTPNRSTSNTTFLRQSSTHPAPEEPTELASTTLSGPQPPREDRNKEVPGSKCTPRKKAICLGAEVMVVIFAAVIAVMVVVFKPQIFKPDPHETKVATVESLYPSCQVNHKDWVGDGTCNRANYNKRECGWDGGDCIKKFWPECHAKTPEAFLGLGNGKCNAAFNVIECGFDLGDCRPNWADEDVLKLRTLVKKYPGCFFDGMDIDRIGDDDCDGGKYNTEECGWDGGDCLEFNRRYPNCNVDSPDWINDNMCDGSQYNNAACGWDGGDCLFNEKPDKGCIGSISSTSFGKTRAWCQYKCMDEGSRCKAYDFRTGFNDRCRIFSSYSSMTNDSYSTCYISYVWQ